MNDFDEIMAKANNNSTQTKKPFDKEAWKEKKQQERQEAYALIDSTADLVKSDVNKFKEYLDVQGRFDKYSVGNALIITAKMPNATQLKDFNDWKEAGASIKKNK